MITAYLDESEHSDSDKYTVVAGFRGKKDNRDLFLPEWKQALGNRKCLHMQSLRWNHADAEHRVRDLLARLAPVPYKCGLIPVYAAVRANDYSDLTRGYPRLEAIGGYLLSLTHVFTLLMETVPVVERVKIVCEEQSQYEATAHELFRVFKKQGKRDGGIARLASLDFVPKGSIVGIEPADYLAFSIAKTFLEPESKKALWSRPIQDYAAHVNCRTGMWLPQDIARQTIISIRNEMLP